MRIMQLSDYEEVYALWKKTEGLDLNPVDASKEGIQRYLLRNPNSCFVEEREGRIVGVILAGHDGRRGTLHHLAVEKSYRRKKIAQELVQKSVEELHKEGITKVALFVYKENASARAFWQKQGFTQRKDIVYFDKALTEMNLSEEEKSREV